MKSRLVVCASLLVAGCGGSSAGGVSGFAHSYAASYCHFIYHCCTPSDRENPANPFAAILSSEESLGFASEDGCTSALGVQAQIALAPYEDSVAARRMSYEDESGQACLSALASASSACDPNAFLAATQISGVCDVPTFFIGLVRPDGSCTMDGDCGVGNSICEPVDGGVDQGESTSDVISGAATCVSPPADGMPCGYDIADGACGAGACCSDLDSICEPYVLVGAACDTGCGPNSCNPQAAYCDSAGTRNCQALIASGGSCNPLYYGSDCASFNCLSTSNGATYTCQAASVVLQICVGNPNGF